jgi:hypothetical protein
MIEGVMCRETSRLLHSCYFKKEAELKKNELKTQGYQDLRVIEKFKRLDDGAQVRIGYEVWGWK